MAEIIVFEGTDGCGKQTQSTLLYNYLKEKGKNVRLQSFPNYESTSSSLVKLYLNGDFGSDINCLDAYQTSTLYAVDRLYTMHTLKEFLKSDGYLILDRYVESNMIHQASKIKDKNLKDKYLDWIYNFEYEVLKLPKPTKTFFLNMPVDFSIKLKTERNINKAGLKNDIQEKDNEHLIKAYNNGLYIAEKYKFSKIDCVENDRIKSIEEIHSEIISLLD